MCFKNKIMQKILNYISFVTLMMATIMVVTITYWLVYPYKVVTVERDPMQVLTKEVKAGESLCYAVNFCKYTEHTATITKVLVDGVLYQLGTVEGIFGKGCQNLKVELTIPEKIPAGEYYLIQKWSYKVNPIRTVSVSARTEMFTVTK